MPSHSLPNRLHGPGSSLHYTASAPHLTPEMTPVLLRSQRSPTPSPRVSYREPLAENNRGMANQDHSGQLLWRTPELAQGPLMLQQNKPQRSMGPASPRLSYREQRSPDTNHSPIQDSTGQFGQSAQVPVGAPKARANSPGYAVAVPKFSVQVSGTSRAKVMMRRSASPSQTYAATAAELKRQVSSPRTLAAQRCASTAAPVSSITAQKSSSTAAELQRPASSPRTITVDRCGDLVLKSPRRTNAGDKCPSAAELQRAPSSPRMIAADICASKGAEPQRQVSSGSQRCAPTAAEFHFQVTTPRTLAAQACSPAAAEIHISLSSPRTITGDRCACNAAELQHPTSSPQTSKVDRCASTAAEPQRWVSSPGAVTSQKCALVSTEPQRQVSGPQANAAQKCSSAAAPVSSPRTISADRCACTAAELQHQAPSPRTIAAERGRSSSPGHASLKKSMFAKRSPSPRQSRSPHCSPHSSPHCSKRSLGDLPRRKDQEDSWATKQSPTGALKMEVQALISALGKQHEQCQELKPELLSLNDDENKVKSHVQRVHQVVAAAPDGEVRDLCASLACQQAKQEKSLRILTNIMDVLQQQVQTLLRSTRDTLMHDSEVLKQELNAAEDALAEKPAPMQKAQTKPDPQLWEKVESKMAERDKELKAWFANCCVSAMKETFGWHLQRHEEAIKLLNSQFCTLGELTRQSLASAEEISEESEPQPSALKFLDTIVELPDQDLDAQDRDNDVLDLASKQSACAMPDQIHKAVKTTLEAWDKGSAGHVACPESNSPNANELLHAKNL
mmetsp:Transcript_127777/g.238857  ORF Transcript_127777/g.238857 Transcript_127777/m.238857 type:complete len:791 (-) Transcript_127777:1-2373(-)